MDKQNKDRKAYSKADNGQWQTQTRKDAKRQRHKVIKRQRDKETKRQRDKEAKRQRRKQTNRQTDIRLTLVSFLSTSLTYFVGLTVSSSLSSRLEGWTLLLPRAWSRFRSRPNLTELARLEAARVAAARGLSELFLFLTIRGLPGARDESDTDGSALISVVVAWKKIVFFKCDQTTTKAYFTLFADTPSHFRNKLKY
jgi:cation transport ATPase